MSKPALVILAAGMATRYGSQKQTEGFGPNGETIMDYSIYDAIESGFGKIVFIIRKDFAEQFEPVFNKKLANKNVAVEYVYQDLQKFTEGFDIPEERVKPWGTAHAMLCAKEAIKEPFAIINADDFYGRDAFKMAADFLNQKCTATQQAIIGYALKNTLSENGTVSRGVCVIDEKGNLQKVDERLKVYSQNGEMVYDENGTIIPIPDDTKASMNFWCFHPTVLDVTKEQFSVFLSAHSQELKSEFFLPLIGDFLIANNLSILEVIPTNAKWFGVTYKEDAPIVKERVQELITQKVYPLTIW